MRILLIGYGKMGKAIEQVALQKGHSIAYTIDLANSALLTNINPKTVDIAIEFTQPEAAYHNIYQCLSQGIPTLSGTTGWLHHKEAIEQYCQKKGGTFFYATNFSIGVNIFFKLNELLAKLMCQRPEYKVALEEIHHTTKQDVPSGTAITLAADIIKNIPSKKQWITVPTNQEDTISINSQRRSDVPGTHIVTYTALLDTLEIKHTAHSREGFALGAVLVAEWIQGQKGILGMQDFLQLAC
ncbi:MAG: 4-hydroxy-tetrahydrodipicolinate reductase [Bacteroidota bacterium]